MAVQAGVPSPQQDALASAVSDPRDDEAALIREAKSGSPEAWARIYDQYASNIYRYALARLGQRQAAEDITSTVFLKALTSIASYNPSRRPLLAWLYGVARHAVADYLAKWRPSAELTWASEKALVEAVAVEERLDLQAALAELTEQQREIVVLYYYGGFSVPEIAMILGRKERVVYSLQARALSALRRHLV